ncbi:NADH-cytochrome b5 reductase [Perkinsus olseni]|uniref:NADH-cytochrome b5 reductase n=1 Tax=Perkinsus olseni TaxID=32597 RepID=A0A7J6M1Y6_PEROL|nr:NADH-cytochrome b5 reductase [Perkinsus olseni]KAF4671624.1 NADH-cytochrome b5 reductase [Perkinsus olseni]
MPVDPEFLLGHAAVERRRARKRRSYRRLAWRCSCLVLVALAVVCIGGLGAAVTQALHAHYVELVDKRNVTASTIQYTIDYPSQDNIHPGQWIKYEAPSERTRNYSPVATDDGQATMLAVKVLSGVSLEMAQDVWPGSLMHIYGPLPPLPAILRSLDTSAARVGFFCFGGAITACVDPIRALLNHGAEVRLLYFNKGPEQVLFRRQLDGLKALYPEKYRVHYVYTRPGEKADSPGEWTGRLNSDMVADIFSDWYDFPARFESAGHWKDRVYDMPLGEWLGETLWE